MTHYPDLTPDLPILLVEINRALVEATSASFDRTGTQQEFFLLLDHLLYDLRNEPLESVIALHAKDLRTAFALYESATEQPGYAYPHGSAHSDYYNALIEVIREKLPESVPVDKEMLAHWQETWACAYSGNPQVKISRKDWDEALDCATKLHLVRMRELTSQDGAEARQRFEEVLRNSHAEATPDELETLKLYLLEAAAEKVCERGNLFFSR